MPHSGTTSSGPGVPSAVRLRRFLAWRAWVVVATVGARGLLAGAEAPAAKPAAPAPNSNAACLECHSDPDLFMKQAGHKVSLFVDEKIGARSAHQTLDCIDCHEKYDGDSSPHRKPSTTVDCASCHENTAKKHAFHPRLAQQPVPAGDDTNCTACHGKHEVAALKSPAFPFKDGPEAAACGRCH